MPEMDHQYKLSADLFYVSSIIRGEIADIVSVCLALERKGYLGRFCPRHPNCEPVSCMSRDDRRGVLIRPKTVDPYA